MPNSARIRFGPAMRTGFIKMIPILSHNLTLTETNKYVVVFVEIVFLSMGKKAGLKTFGI